ncbi:MAG: hypothetical protein ABIE07_03610 [Candidatus Zixiibacteriota bacterium]
MGIHKRIENDGPTRVSPVFSGKHPDGKPINGHRHAFYLPTDEDGDGRLDHLLVFAAEPFNSSELAALDALRSVWQPNRLPDVNLVLVSLSPEIPGQSSNRWVSATPFRGFFIDFSQRLCQYIVSISLLSDTPKP